MDFAPSGVIADAGDPWSLTTDGRLIYLFCEAPRGEVLVRGFADGEEAHRSPSVPASGVRGLAVTRRGGFILDDAGLHAAFAPTEAGGSWGGRSYPLRGEGVGLNGWGAALYVLVHGQGRLSLMQVLGVSGPQTVASAPWIGAEPPGWIQVYLHPRRPLAWLWGGGVKGRVDLPLGEMTLVQEAAAPADIPLHLRPRRELGLMTSQRRHPAPARLAAAPAAGGGWGVLELDSGDFSRPGDDLARPLAILPVEGGLLVAQKEALFHLEPGGGRIKARMLRAPAVEHLALSAVAGGAVLLVRTASGEVVVQDVSVDAGQPPSLVAAQRLLSRDDADVRPEVPPLAVSGEVWLATTVGDRLVLWRRPPGTP